MREIYTIQQVKNNTKVCEFCNQKSLYKIYLGKINIKKPFSHNCIEERITFESENIFLCNECKMNFLEALNTIPMTKWEEKWTEYCFNLNGLKELEEINNVVSSKIVAKVLRSILETIIPVSPFSNLSQAVLEKDIIAVISMIKNKTDLDFQNNQGYTALMLACFYNEVDIVKELIFAGANINLQNYEGDTALVLAAKNGSVQSAKELIKSRAEIHFNGIDGYTVLRNANEKIYDELMMFADTNAYFLAICPKCGKQKRVETNSYTTIDETDFFCEECVEILRVNCTKCGKEEIIECCDIYIEKQIKEGKYLCYDCQPKINLDDLF